MLTRDDLQVHNLTAFLVLGRLLLNVPTGSECYFLKLESWKIRFGLISDTVFYNYSFTGRGTGIRTGRVDMVVPWD